MFSFNHPVWLKRLWASRYGFAVLLLTATLIISVWLTPLIGLGIARFGGRLLAFPGPLFMCAVMLCAWHGGIGPSLFATAVSALAFHYYFRHSPWHPKPDEMRPLLISITQNLLVGLLSAAQRKAKESLRHARDDLKLTVEDLKRTNEALQAESRGRKQTEVALHTESHERKQTEAALIQAQADLARASRLSSMGELSASLAHEINQPIAAAIIDANTCLSWLSRDQPDLEEARAAAVRIAQDGKRAGEIVSRVRMLFRKGVQQRELIDLNELIREMVLLLHSEATKFAVFTRTELATDLPQVMGDRVQLQQVLMNLMMNSIEAMKDVNGIRELAVQSQHGEDGQVLISVTDTGIGLPPQQAEKIFDAFFTTKPHGTGIGLRISRSIVGAHGGRLWATDHPPRGARLSFTLPIDGSAGDSIEL